MGRSEPWAVGGLGRRVARARDVAARRRPGLNVLLVHSLSAFSPKICTKVPQVMNRKNVYLAILYNFHKGHLVFFSKDLAQKVCQL
jgi:hypothetical protein